jgi:ABC-2 type transport system permease protein
MLVVNDWRLLLSFFNHGATCFILSILTTRFIYPLLSLEGRGFWTVGLAPIPRTRIVWQKFTLCFLLCVGVSLPLMILSNRTLQITGNFVWVSGLAMLVMSTGLTSLSVGLGAILPDFKEDNPARIANGIGGTMNVMLSLAYIGFSLLLLIAPTILLGSKTFGETMQRFLPLYGAFVVLVQAFLIWLPMRIGLRRWENMEF